MKQKHLCNKELIGQNDLSCRFVFHKHLGNCKIEELGTIIRVLEHKYNCRVVEPKKTSL